MALGGNDFNAIRISLASPDQIRIWSYGEVAKPETINYRTLRPEKDGLFCERIFGPTKDWECYCGKYKKIRYKGVICDRCGVEVARAKVRRERMGHITLAAPVAHIWFSKGTPSRLGLMLDLSPRNLDRVLYFAQYLITNVDSELQAMRIEELQNELDDGVERIESEGEAKLEELNGQLAELGEPVETDDEEENPDDPRRILEAEIHKVTLEIDEKRDEMEEELASQIDDLESLSVGGLLTESRYRELRDQFAGIFEAGMGAEAVLQVLGKLDIEELREHLREEMQSTSGQRRKKAIKRMSVVEAFRNSGNKPEWMVLTSLPVLPPELRPMVQLDGGRFATSDLNDLYRRVINRNNRLKRLIDLSAPEIIVRNEKRMLQESVDALVDNGRRGRAVAGSHNHRLKSLSDLLRGKQGRFRQNLLGKRVDYSGRSVIIAGPELKLHQCGLPRRMALELFKPFVMNRLVMKGYAHNIKSAKRMAERIQPAVWDILEDVVKDRLVLLNRAPTLHRLGIQAFEPVLIDGSAIQLHPLVCTAFNADFDGDQMAVHVPLSREAVLEAKQMMLSTYNMLSPSSGEPIVAPTLDIVLGTYYMTIVDESARGAGRAFSSAEDALLAHELGSIELRAPITVTMEGEQVETTAGRIIINDTLPDEMEFKNEEIEKGVLKDIVAEVYTILGNDGTAEVLDQIKNLGFHNATQAGITIAISDVEVPREKESIIADAESDLDRIEELYLDGFVTEQGRYEAAVSVWTNANNKLTQVIQDNLESYGGIYLMANSGAKGNIAQIKQMAGMRGLMSDPKGRIIDRPIKSNFREGLSVLEYFISTHGARKGLTDTALNTAHSGYLTRRLIDVSQEIIILSDDCGTPNGIWVHADDIEEGAAPYLDQIRTRYLALPVADPNTGEILFERNDVLDDPTVEILQKAGVRSVMVRSPMTCECERGICQMCYGLSLANMRPSMIGEAVGIIAAQSIGEPGTQLTMRTFHTGGVAGEDITSGMPRVQELFEARAPKGEAVLSEIDGTVEVVEEPDYRSIRVSSVEEYTDEYFLPEGFTPKVEDGSLVNIGEMLAEPDEDGELDDESAALATPDLMARVSGKVSIDGDLITIAWTDEEQREYKNIPAASHITVRTGDSVTAGAALTEGAKNPKDILRIQGRDAVQRYLIDEVQKVYRSQGVPIHNKHIELIISQMLRNVEIDDPGDTDLLPDDRVDRRVYEQRNAEVLAEGGEPATATPVLLGITRASLNTDSFLSAASFQETTRVLTESAVNGKVDHLRGLKENVIIEGSSLPGSISPRTESAA
ncbi:MAG: DNA-directed RNA polymerase subunit beta' [Dehalococcoidia bacterium]|nr:DNA-directed RNA polymerase subunit beta' [Dehalococcoidia bacterium]